jgi:hypothetical protein
MKSPTKRRKTTTPSGETQVFSLDVSILNGPMSERFVRNNPKVSRTIAICGDHTLAHLHGAIFNAFGRDDEHLYEFQIGGKEPMDRKARRYGLSMVIDDLFDEPKSHGSVERTTLDSLGLATGDVFRYWFDFGDDWWHQITVLTITAKAPRGKLPKVTQRVGQSPPQYVDWDEEE